MQSKTDQVVRLAALTLLLWAGGLLAAPDPAATGDDLASRIAQRFSRRIPSTHLMRLPMGDVVS